jgi:hypothetical protein
MHFAPFVSDPPTLGDTMKTAGIWLLIFGVGSIALNFLGMEFKILMWIDNWGVEVGWGIRVGLAVVGAVLLVLGARQEVKQPV